MGADEWGLLVGGSFFFDKVPGSGLVLNERLTCSNPVRMVMIGPGLAAIDGCVLAQWAGSGVYRASPMVGRGAGGEGDLSPAGRV